MLASRCCKNCGMAKSHARNWCWIMPCSAQVLAAKCCNCCANMRLRDSNTAWQKYCTQMRLHRWMLIHRDSFIQGWVYIEMLFTKTCFFTDAYTYRCFYAEMPLRAAALIHRCFYTGILLHTAAFAHRHAATSTHRCLYTAMLLHTCALHRKSCDTEYPLHRENFCTNTLTWRC